MTKQERIVVSAYTGILMCDFADMHKYIEEKLGRPIFTHDFAIKCIQDEVKEKTKPDFLALCNEDKQAEFDEEKTDKNILITYEEFERHINDMLFVREYQLSLDNFFKQRNHNEKTGYIDIQFPTLEENLVKLLETVTDDKNDRWIYYWVYDLDYGKRYEKGMVEIDNKMVVLKTVRDLWDILNDNPHFEDS